MDPRLLSLIKEHSGTRCQKVLTCAQDVLDAVTAASAPAAPRMPWEPDLSWALGIDVIVAPDSAPGTWRLVRHDHCTVEYVHSAIDSREVGVVHHRECSVLGSSEDPPAS